MTEPDRSTPEPFLRATVIGSVRADYEGAGTFHQDGNPTLGSPLAIRVRSDGEGTAAGQKLFPLAPAGRTASAGGASPLAPLDDARDSGSPASTRIRTKLVV